MTPPHPSDDESRWHLRAADPKKGFVRQVSSIPPGPANTGVLSQNMHGGRLSAQLE